MMTDPISDFLIQIKNGYLARKEKIEVPYSKNKEALGKLLVKESYLGKVTVKKEEGSIKKYLIIELLYIGKKPKLTEIVRLSKPSVRIYVKGKQIPKVLGGLGMIIISTPKGFLTGRQARKEGVGGELICKLW
jgi:small subunit ribosomal protein S8